MTPANRSVVQLREHWQKIAILIMHKLGAKEATIDLSDMAWFIALGDRGLMPYVDILGREAMGPSYGFTIALCMTRDEMLNRILQHRAEIKAKTGKDI